MYRFVSTIALLYIARVAYLHRSLNKPTSLQHKQLLLLLFFITNRDEKEKYGINYWIRRIVM